MQQNVRRNVSFHRWVCVRSVKWGRLITDAAFLTVHDGSYLSELSETRSEHIFICPPLYWLLQRDCCVFLFVLDRFHLAPPQNESRHRGRRFTTNCITTSRGEFECISLERKLKSMHIKPQLTLYPYFFKSAFNYHVEFLVKQIHLWCVYHYTPILPIIHGPNV